MRSYFHWRLVFKIYQNKYFASPVKEKGKDTKCTQVFKSTTQINGIKNIPPYIHNGYWHHNLNDTTIQKSKHYVCQARQRG